MTDPSTLAAAIVTKLRAIAALVTLTGNANKITAYEDQFPTSNSVLKAIDEMPHNTVLVVYDGTTAQRLWRHQFRIVVKGGKYTSYFTAIASGVPAGGDGQNFRTTTIHNSCNPIAGDISSRRVTMFPTPDTALDYFEIPVTLTERGIGA